MRKVAGLLMLIFVLLQSGRPALAQLCEIRGSNIQSRSDDLRVSEPQNSA